MIPARLLIPARWRFIATPLDEEPGEQCGEGLKDKKRQKPAEVEKEGLGILGLELKKPGENAGLFAIHQNISI